jgi:hypothetical protein
MYRPLTMELIFPIRDEPSARLMSLKAECLHMAGVISEREEQAVFERAAKINKQHATMSNFPQNTDHTSRPNFGHAQIFAS